MCRYDTLIVMGSRVDLGSGSQLDRRRVSGEWKSNQGEVVLQSTLQPAPVRPFGLGRFGNKAFLRTAAWIEVGFSCMGARKATSGDLSGDLNGEKCEACVPV
jgi:hypothetical protein